MKRLELAIESIILASRWLLVVFYIGLALALAVYALSFGKKLYEFITLAFTLGDTDTILKMLGLIDAALVASLVVMVIISGYENFVSRFDDQEGGVHWLGTIDVGSLKVKVASTIVAISSIHPFAGVFELVDLHDRAVDVADHHPSRLRRLGPHARLYRPADGPRQRQEG